MFYIQSCKKQRGFTLIEVIIAIAITGVIAAAIVTSTTQMISVHSSSSDQFTAISNVRAVGDWISRDSRQADSVNITALNEVIITRQNQARTLTYKVTYTLSGEQLTRAYFENDVLKNTFIIADHISSIVPTFTGNNTMNISATSTVEDVSESRIYEVYLRNSW